MKTLIKPSKLAVYQKKDRNLCLAQKVNNSANFNDLKFYQKLFLLLVVLSTILIFPESPRELETICQYYNSRQICNVL